MKNATLGKKKYISQCSYRFNGNVIYYATMEQKAWKSLGKLNTVWQDN